VTTLYKITKLLIVRNQNYINLREASINEYHYSNVIACSIISQLGQIDKNWFQIDIVLYRLYENYIFCNVKSCGWCALIIEEKFAEVRVKHALYRTKAEYAGSYCGLDGCEYELN
jgi:hypothetical protein